MDRLTTDSRIFAFTRWDAIPVLAGITHWAFFWGMFYFFPRIPLWFMLILGFIYSISISWNINGIFQTWGLLHLIIVELILFLVSKHHIF